MRNVARWVVCAAMVSGCVEQPTQRRNSQASQQEIEAVRRRVASPTAPTPQHRLDYNFGNKVTLLGYDMSPAEVRPGTTVTVTWYWHADASTGDGWHLYTHLDDANGPRINKDNDGDVRRAYQPERWHAGEYVTDRQTFELPADWDSPVVKVHVGLWKGDERMAVVRGQRDADPKPRALAFTIDTGVQPQVAALDAPRATGAITVDGRLDEAAWRTAGTTGPLVNTMTGAPAGPNDAHGTVKVLWDDANLYLGWDVRDEHLVETGTTRDAHYWENDAVEVMIDPDGNGRDYYEIQVSPGNHTFETQQAQPPGAGAFGNVAWNPPLRTAVARTGTLGNDGDTDTGYTVEMAVPWSAINAGAAHVPPAAGDAWRVNFYLMDKVKQGGQRAAGWSAPRTGSFHVPTRFGRITFRAAPPAPSELTADGPFAAPVGAPTARPAEPTPAPSATPRPLPRAVHPTLAAPH